MRRPPVRAPRRAPPLAADRPPRAGPSVAPPMSPAKNVRKKSEKPARSSGSPEYSNRTPPPGKPPANGLPAPALPPDPPGNPPDCPCRRARALIGLPVRPQLVVELALLGVAQDVVRLVDLLEARLRAIAIGRVHVRVVLASELAERLLDLRLATPSGARPGWRSSRGTPSVLPPPPEAGGPGPVMDRALLAPVGSAVIRRSRDRRRLLDGREAPAHLVGRRR